VGGQFVLHSDHATLATGSTYRREQANRASKSDGISSEYFQFSTQAKPKSIKIIKNKNI